MDYTEKWLGEISPGRLRAITKDAYWQLLQMARELRFRQVEKYTVKFRDAPLEVINKVINDMRRQREIQKNPPAPVDYFNKLMETVKEVDPSEVNYYRLTYEGKQVKRIRKAIRFLKAMKAWGGVKQTKSATKRKKKKKKQPHKPPAPPSLFKSLVRLAKRVDPDKAGYYEWAYQQESDANILQAIRFLDKLAQTKSSKKRKVGS